MTPLQSVPRPWRYRDVPTYRQWCHLPTQIVHPHRIYNLASR